MEYSGLKRLRMIVLTLSGELPPYPQFFFLNKFLSKATPPYKTSLLLTSWYFPGAHPAPRLGGGSHPHPPGSRAETPHGVAQRGWDVPNHHPVLAERDQLPHASSELLPQINSLGLAARFTVPSKPVLALWTQREANSPPVLGFLQPFGVPCLAQDLPSPCPNSPTATLGSSATDAPGTVTCQATPCSSRCLGS